MTFTSRGKKLARSHDGHVVPRSEFTARMGQDETVSLDMVSDEAELALRRLSGADVQLRSEQIDALGDLARFVMRGTVLTSKVSSPGSKAAMEVAIDFDRGVVAFSDLVALSRARTFAERYFGLADSAKAAETR